MYLGVALLGNRFARVWPRYLSLSTFPWCLCIDTLWGEHERSSPSTALPVLGSVQLFCFSRLQCALVVLLGIALRLQSPAFLHMVIDHLESSFVKKYLFTSHAHCLFGLSFS